MFFCVVYWFVFGFVFKVFFPSCVPSTGLYWDLFSRCVFCVVCWFVLGFVFKVLVVVVFAPSTGLC